MTTETPKNGLHTDYRGNGQKQSEVNYKDGKMHGKFTGWAVNGQKWIEMDYKDGKCISGDC